MNLLAVLLNPQGLLSSLKEYLQLFLCQNCWAGSDRIRKYENPPPFSILYLNNIQSFYAKIIQKCSIRMAFLGGLNNHLEISLLIKNYINRARFMMQYRIYLQILFSIVDYNLITQYYLFSRGYFKTQKKCTSKRR